MPDCLAIGGSIKFLKVQTFFNSFIIANDNVTVYRSSCSECRVVFINNLKLKNAELKESNILLIADAVEEIRSNYFQEIRQRFSHGAKLPRKEHFPVLSIGIHPR